MCPVLKLDVGDMVEMFKIRGYQNKVVKDGARTYQQVELANPLKLSAFTLVQSPLKHVRRLGRMRFLSASLRMEFDNLTIRSSLSLLLSDSSTTIYMSVMFLVPTIFSRFDVFRSAKIHIIFGNLVQYFKKNEEKMNGGVLPLKKRTRK